MSTTITYKGSTIATVNNNTKTLNTAGKYLEANVVLTDVSGGQGSGYAWETVFDGIIHMPEAGETILGDLVDFNYYTTIPWTEPINYMSVWRVTVNGDPYICTATWEGISTGDSYAIGDYSLVNSDYTPDEDPIYDYIPFYMQRFGSLLLIRISGSSLDAHILIQKQISSNEGGNGYDNEFIERALIGAYSNSTVTTIGKYAFRELPTLTSVYFPNVVNINNGFA